MSMFDGWLKISNGDLPKDGDVIITVEKNEKGQAIYDLFTVNSYILECLTGGAFDPRFTFNYWGYPPKPVDLNS